MKRRDDLQAPHRRPSISIFRTSFSISFMSVSSSHGFTSRIMLDLAMRTGSEREKERKTQINQWNVAERFIIVRVYALLDFLAAYAASRSSLIFAASASSPYRIEWSKNFRASRIIIIETEWKNSRRALRCTVPTHECNGHNNIIYWMNLTLWEYLV